MTNLTERTDLSDIQNTLKHFRKLSDYFQKKYMEIGKIWKPTNGNGLDEQIYRTKNQTFIKTMERLYEKSRSLANTYADWFSEILYFESTPNLKEYISKIRSSSQQYLEEDNKFLSELKILIEEKKRINKKEPCGVSFSFVERNIDLHQQLLQRLEEIEGDLIAIEKSERYEIENNHNREAQCMNLFQHFSDYRSIKFKNISYTLTPNQALVIRLFHENWLKGTCELSSGYLLENIESAGNRLRDVFKNSPLWNSLIVQTPRKGVYKFNI